MTTDRREGPADHETVLSEVRKLLARSAAYHALPDDEKQTMEANMARIGRYLSDPAWLDDDPTPRATALADKKKQPDPLTDFKSRMAKGPGLVGNEFKAGAMHQGVEEFGRLVQTVDFPKFVSGLVQGVFQAVVDASIQQMRAYGELLAGAAKTVDQFAQDHVSDSQARDHIRDRFPNAVRIDTSNENGPARLAHAEGDSNVDVGAAFGVGSIDLDDEEGEGKLVQAAKRDIARQRQQMLGTMLLLGINRIVVTDGQINAKVVFDIKAQDSAHRRSSAAWHDAQHDTMDTHTSVTGPFGNIFGGASADFSMSNDHVATVSSAVDDTSDSKAEMKAKLTGDVHLAFKSETFPLERMVDVMGMQTINDRARPLPLRGGPAAAPAPAAAAAPAPAPAPPAPGAAR